MNKNREVIVKRIRTMLLIAQLIINVMVVVNVLAIMGDEEE